MPMSKLRRGPLACATGIAGLAALIVLSLPRTIVHAQTPAETIPIESSQVPEWQKAAGGKMLFEVASVKLGNAGTFTSPNFALDFLDSFSGANPHGRFVAQFPLRTYVGFAYKLFPYSQEQNDTMLAHVPKWVSTDQYAVNAKAEGDPTKDQMRLMMQSLLVDRFKLAVHFERLEVPVLALVLDKPGRTGAKLNPHSNGVPCDVSPPSDVFPPVCNVISAIGRPNNSFLMGSRNVTMAQVAASLTSAGRLARPVVDQTGLDGRFDFTLEWIGESNDPAPADLQEGTTFQEALQEQLGLKLKSTKATMDTLVIDHVERPSEN
jgi:bla regulator protein blaR1